MSLPILLLLVFSFLDCSGLVSAAARQNGEGPKLPILSLLFFPCSYYSSYFPVAFLLSDSPT